jgi:hypothetical protein
MTHLFRIGLVAALGVLVACKQREAPTPEPRPVPSAAHAPGASEAPRPNPAPLALAPSTTASAAPSNAPAAIEAAEDADALDAKIKASPKAWTGKTVRARGLYFNTEGFAGTPMLHFKGAGRKAEYTCVGKEGTDMGDFKDWAPIVVEGKVLNGSLFLNPCKVVSK